ncbi:peptidoglycan DD-metalloendopeptidase family protein [Microseira sp. BLCC-F43]|uniref:M23 family metallopeptidase n=1 Tax=Microseira sp. BLCC-F43 TaxID=3153602 RepID=UPI0035B75E80
MEKPINRDKQIKLQSEETQLVALATNPSRGKFWQQVMLAQGIGWVGALGILGSSIAWTQEQASNPGGGSTIVEALPKASPIEPNLAAPRRAPARSGRRLRARMQRQRQRITSAVNNNTYIDRTDYSLGATRRRSGRTDTYDAPSSVVMTERTTRRQTTIARRQRAIEAGESVARVRTRVRSNLFRRDSASETQTDRSIEIPVYRYRVGRISRRSQITRRNSQPTQFGRISRGSQIARRREQQIQVDRISRRVQIARRAPQIQVDRIPRRVQIARNSQPTHVERSTRRSQIARRGQPEPERSNRRSQIARIVQPEPERSNRRSQKARIGQPEPERSARRSQIARSRRPAQIPIEYVARTSASERIANTSSINHFRRRSQTAWRSSHRGPEVAAVGQIQIGSVTPNPNSVRVRHWNGIGTQTTLPQRLAPQPIGSEQNSQPIPPWPGLAYNTATSKPQEYPRRPTLPIIFPLSIPAQITSVFGWRIHPISGDLRFHTGTDLGAPIGTPVVAAYPGRVALADTLSGYGLTVIIQHNDGTQETRYAHLSEVYVEPGDFIEQGTTIGRVGNTGTSTGPHLHFEIREQTPEGWVAIDAGAQIESSLARLLNTLQIAQSPQSETTESTKLAQPKTQLDNTELPEIIVPNTPAYFVPPLTGG